MVLPGSIQKSDSITQHRAQLVHPVEQFNALVGGGILETLHHLGEIDADGFHRFLQRAALLAGGALGLARSPNFGKVYDLRHDTNILADFLADVTLLLDYFASTLRKPFNLMRNTVENLEFARVQSRRGPKAPAMRT